MFHTYADSGALGIGVQNYRGFRFNWTGIPNEAPAIVVLKDDKTSKTSVYVSWNGDTRTKSWRFYEVGDDNSISQILGEVKRESFETVLDIGTEEVGKVQADALDVEGKILVRTAKVKLETLIHEYRKPEKTQQKHLEREPKGILGWLTFKGQKLFGDNDL